MDSRPTTEQATTNTDQSPAEPELKSGVKLPLTVSQLRWKLGRKAKQEPSFRFYALYDRIYRHDVLTAAWWLVLKNKGAPGVDRQSCQDIIDGPSAASRTTLRGVGRRSHRASTFGCSRSATSKGSARSAASLGGARTVFRCGVFWAWR